MSSFAATFPELTSGDPTVAHIMMSLDQVQLAQLYDNFVTSRNLCAKFYHENIKLRQEVTSLKAELAFWETNDY
jgi:hypothetical protein